MSCLESGIRSYRIEYVAESTAGVAPANPSWNLYSDTVQNFTASSGLEIAERRGIGNVDVENFEPGREEPSFTVTYDAQQDLSADAANDGLTRDTDNCLPNTHTILARQTLASGGVDGGGERLYTVVLGGYIGTVNISGDPGSTAAVPVELTYSAEKIRSYKFDQPADGTAFNVQSSDAGDTSQTLTIEDDTGTTEAVSLSGTSAVTTTKTDWASLDAAELDAETAGDVTIEDDSGNVLATLYGTDTYSGAEGDLGVPVTDTGSHASAIGSAYENFLGDTVERPSGTDIGENLSSVELTVENNLEVQPRNIRRPQISPGIREIMVSANVFGTAESHDAIIENLQATENNIVWTLTNTTITVSNAVLTSPGERAPTAEEAFMELSNEFTGQGITLS